jgi:hypothetical protein
VSLGAQNSIHTILAGEGIDCPRILVETGTYLGHGIEQGLGHFDEIHSIELVEQFANRAAETFAAHSEVTIHWGDSAEKVLELSPHLNEPVLFYLDAHYSGGSTAYGRTEDEGCPVLRELEVLARRPEKDVVIIDDISLMGKRSWSGIEGDPIYPRTQFDFTHITLEKLFAAYAKPCRRTRRAPNAHGGCDWMILSPIEVSAVEAAAVAGAHRSCLRPRTIREEQSSSTQSNRSTRASDPHRYPAIRALSQK